MNISKYKLQKRSKSKVANVSARFAISDSSFTDGASITVLPPLPEHINTNLGSNQKFQLDIESILCPLVDFKAFAFSPLTLEREIGVPRTLARNLSVGHFQPAANDPLGSSLKKKLFSSRFPKTLNKAGRSIFDSQIWWYGRCQLVFVCGNLTNPGDWVSPCTLQNKK